MNDAPAGEVVTIDGPAGSGKTTVSRLVAQALGYAVLDTGAMYRAAALKLARLGVDLADEPAVARTMGATEIDLRVDETGCARVLLDGRDVSVAIRAPGMGQAASDASTLAPVRARMVELQRAVGRRGRIVAEGRDMGTVVFPGARHKFYLDARLDERARRRTLEESGSEAGLEQTIEELWARDHQDMTRRLAPLARAPDAEVIDTTDLAVPEVVDRIVSRVHARRAETQDSP